MKSWELYTSRERRKLMFVLFLVGTSNYLDRNVISVLLEQIKAEFQVSDTMLGLLSGLSFALLYATLGIPVARWADRGDRRHVITVSLSIWSLMTMLCGLATSYWQLAAARFGVGAGEAGAIPPSQSLLVDYYPPEQRSWALGVFTMSSSAGYALALVVGGAITQHYGWRAAFVVFGAAGLFLAVLTHLMLKEPRKALRGTVALQSAESLSVAIRELLAKPCFRNLLCAHAVYFLMAYGAIVFVVSLLIRAHGLSVAEAGGLFGAIYAMGAVIGSIAGGMLADRLAQRDRAWLAKISGCAMWVAIPLFECALGAPHLVVMIPFLLLAVIALTASSPPAYAAIHAVCGSKRRALSVALVFFVANLVGLGLGPVMAGALSDGFGAVYGTAEGLRYALMIMTCALAPAGWLMLRAARTLERDAED